ncbi:MAG: ATP-dependent DNA helicase RecG [Anaerolineaceae bacterium]|jgi:ATP-dependent DNA helicase RecG
MQTITERILRIIELEAHQGYQNRAVMGGLQRLADTWISEGREIGLSEKLIAEVTKQLVLYPDQPLEGRRETLGLLIMLLDKTQGFQLPLIKNEAQKKASVPDSIPVNKPATEKKNTAQVSKPKPSKVNPAKPKPEMKPANVPVQPIGSTGLDASVSVIHGVGDKQAKNLTKLNILRIRDLLYHFPRRYEDYSKLKPISALRYGEEVTIAAYVVDARLIPTRKGTKVIEAVVSDTTGSLRLMWFNQLFQLRYLKKDKLLSISGRVEVYAGRLVMIHPDYEAIDKQQLNTNRIVPIYPLTALVSQRWLRRTIYNALDYWANKVEEFLPPKVLKQANLMGVEEALRQVHFPDSEELLKAAQHRLAFEELFLLQLGVMHQKKQWQGLQGSPYQVSDAWLVEYMARLPYQLTQAQQDAVADIRNDLALTRPMNRLLQGDVGSGKTVVAVLGMSIVMQSGAQAALMAPTSILAEQHYRSISKLLSEADPDGKPFLESGQVRLLTGDTATKERKEIQAGLESGYIKLLIGTHALIEGPVKFQNLQMVVVDEQHRFGVEQRAALRKKGSNPHLLVMTATPIPRSLQLTVFGDLDVSVMDEMPVGRLPIETEIVQPHQRQTVYKKIEQQVQEGAQAFVIYPLVEQGENEESKAAVEEQKRLQEEVFPHLRIGLVHGRLKPSEKDQVMLDFRNKLYDVLVSTSVVEVGVDVPNASIMVIEGANRFGLAQLHQFRGRVGRGNQQSYCYLIPDSENDVENERLRVMTETNDGFVLAEKDLEQRGPGDFLGTRQAGFMDLRMANLADVRLIAEARKIAEQVIKEDPELKKPESQSLWRALISSWPSLHGKGEMS